MAETLTWADALRAHTTEGWLSRPLADGWLECYACGHRCRIPPGKPGICRVRVNEGGVLRVPHGYVAGLACDPIEKKPFFHVLPGTVAFSFGMLGCDLHCGYCFPGDTIVQTSTGPCAIADLFDREPTRESRPDAEIARPSDLRVPTHTGSIRRVLAVYKHRYTGPLVELLPLESPPLRCTPDHRIYATTDPATDPAPVRARDLTTHHLLMVPGPVEQAAQRTVERAEYHDATGPDRIPTVATLDVASSYGLVPIRAIQRTHFEGDVYNLEVEADHSYVAGLFAVSNCQNWETSQALRDPKALAPPRPIEAEAIAEQALRLGASTVTSTYNEPLITAEWAIEVFRHARARGLKTSFVSNGNATPEVLEALRPWVDLYKVDLKSFRDRAYRQLGGRLDRILDTIPRLVQMGFWTEIVTLIVPGFNDTDEELTDIARFLVGISPDIPWHVTAFHTDYRMSDRDDTPSATLVRAWEIGKREGLRYVYAGNRPGRVGPREHTFCPGCGKAVVERLGFQVLAMRLRDGACAACGTRIPGVWA